MHVLTPNAEVFRPVEPFAGVQPESLKGKTVAFLNNGWQSMSAMVDSMRTTLLNEYGVAEVLEYAIPVTTPAPESVLKEVAELADIAVVGLAN